MSELMSTLEFVRAYIDDLLCITKESFQDHLNKLRLVFQRVQKAGLKVKAPKCKFCALETDYLGYVLSTDGIRPQPKKIEPILALTEPNNVKDVRKFLGMVQVQYYPDMQWNAGPTHRLSR